MERPAGDETVDWQVETRQLLIHHSPTTNIYEQQQQHIG